MRTRIAPFIALLLAIPAAWSTSVSLDDDGVNRPVSKVTTILKDMLTSLQKDAEADQDTYEKTVCWCTTNDQDKTEAIKTAEDKISMLTERIAELSAQSAKLNADIVNHNKEIAENRDALDKATAQREKELAEFTEAEKDLIGSISSLSGAIETLSKHNGGGEDNSGFLQVKDRHLLGIQAMVDYELKKHADMLQGALTTSEMKTVSQFVQAPAGAKNFIDADNTFDQSYAPRSGKIFGVLTTMKEQFDSNLKDMQENESTKQKEYEGLKASLLESIATGEDQVATKTEQLADVDERHATSNVALTDTRATLDADEKYLLTLKEHCSNIDKEMEERTKTRQLEMEAVTKALSFLASDEAQDLFSRTFGASFIQTTSDSATRSKVVKLLDRVALKSGNPRLSNLAVSVRLDAFTKVKAAIDKMIADLTKQQDLEVKTKEFCVKALNENELETEKKHRDRTDSEVRIQDLDTQIKTLEDEIKHLKEQIFSAQQQLKRAGEDREAESKEFQSIVTDQLNTQAILHKTMEVLNEFYKRNALVQVSGKQAPAGPPPPAGFKEYKDAESSSGVLSMIEQIIKDAKAMQEDATKAEHEATAAYASFVEESNTAITTMKNEITNKELAKGKAEEDLQEEHAALVATLSDLEDLKDSHDDLHEKCDFTLKNFDVRQTARDEEISALKQAKAILSGANFN